MGAVTPKCGGGQLDEKQFHEMGKHRKYEIIDGRLRCTYVSKLSKLFIGWRTQADIGLVMRAKRGSDIPRRVYDNLLTGYFDTSSSLSPPLEEACQKLVMLREMSETKLMTTTDDSVTSKSPKVELRTSSSRTTTPRTEKTSPKKTAKNDFEDDDGKGGNAPEGGQGNQETQDDSSIIAGDCAMADDTPGVIRRASNSYDIPAPSLPSFRRGSAREYPRLYAHIRSAKSAVTNAQVSQERGREMEWEWEGRLRRSEDRSMSLVGVNDQLLARQNFLLEELAHAKAAAAEWKMLATDFKANALLLRENLANTRERLTKARAELEVKQDKTCSASDARELEAQRERISGERLCVCVGGLWERHGVLRQAWETLRAEVESEMERHRLDLDSVVEQVIGSLGRVRKSSTLLRQQIKAEIAIRKRALSELRSAKGNIRVFARVRPMSAAERKEDKVSRFVLTGDGIRYEDKSFELDRVFGPEDTQEDVYSACEPILVTCMEGHNVCVYAYGQTNSGKTYTMEGNYNAGDPKGAGLVYRTLVRYLGIADSRKVLGWEYEITLSALEIYKENIYDLYKRSGTKRDRNDSGGAGGTAGHSPNGNEASSSSTHIAGTDIHLNSNSPLKIFTVDNCVVLPGLSKQTVASTKDVEDFLRCTSRMRTVGRTSFNERSSRSHSIVLATISGSHPSQGSFTSTLMMIDMAGSERLKTSAKTGAGQAAHSFSEEASQTGSINKSISAFRGVLLALESKCAHVPFRDSKLTTLLQNAILNKAQTVMIATLSPRLRDYEESKRSISFAASIRKVEVGKSTKNKSFADGTRRASANQNGSPTKSEGTSSRPCTPSASRRNVRSPRFPKRPVGNNFSPLSSSSTSHPFASPSKFSKARRERSIGDFSKKIKRARSRPGKRNMSGSADRRDNKKNSSRSSGTDSVTAKESDKVDRSDGHSAETKTAFLRKAHSENSVASK
eukprot:CAMPEP_0184503716 /NCGR_PEP_ID=MMETSP0113_2-20130426/52057_1 /TAXON_ID=91329 /ORGANISM="Norrisiella sphaerica, Strain BC52" /LENGTH=959 /DNA_ID=CAMNT_0026893265 /DNA_START=365 /DNA_END=3244 /DNA_ORIENTATION=+